MYDVVALGELLIDFTNNGVSAQGNPMFEANPGGAPGNAMAMLAKLGRKTAFITKVGDDYLGHLLRDVIAEVGIDPAGVNIDYEVPTTLAFVATGEGGERSFSFYRNPGADVMLKVSDVPLSMVENTKIFHTGTLSMTHPESLAATEFAIKKAKEAGALISLDPNYRESLWESPEAAIEKIWQVIEICDILKISDNEIELLTGETDIDKGIEKIKSRCNSKLICATLGPDGSIAYYNNLRVEGAPFKLESTIETTGAGDTFTGTMLNYVLIYGIDGLDEVKLKETLTFANAAAALITTKKGALRVMPEKSEVEALIACN